MFQMQVSSALFQEKVQTRYSKIYRSVSILWRFTFHLKCDKMARKSRTSIIRFDFRKKSTEKGTYKEIRTFSEECLY